jgi:hypothetical protein
MKGNLMSKAENIEIFAKHDAPNYESSYNPAVHTPSRKMTFGKNWMQVISLGCLPLLCATVFAVQGSPRVLQWIIKIINSLF